MRNISNDHENSFEYQKVNDLIITGAELYSSSAAQIIAKILGIDEELLTDGDSPYYWHNLTSEDWPKLLALTK